MIVLIKVLNKIMTLIQSHLVMSTIVKYIIPDITLLYLYDYNMIAFLMHLERERDCKCKLKK